MSTSEIPAIPNNEIRRVTDDEIQARKLSTGLIATGNVISKFAELDKISHTTAAVHNFDGSVNKQLSLSALATGGGCEQGSDLINGVIDVEYWYVHLVELVSEKTGEVNQAPRTVLITPAGEGYQFVSFGILQSLRVILSYLGVERLDPPAKVRIKQRKTRKGWNVLYLEPVIPTE